jgi:ABC-2 type transport system ATP-binding protein
MSTAVAVDDLHKSYGPVRALEGVSFRIEPGEVYALLGPNGAGKTTTIEILEGYRRADRGTVTVLGVDPATAGEAFRDRIGIVLQSTGIEDVLTVREAVAHYARPYSRRRSADETIDLAGLGPQAGSRIRTLSGGQRRRLDLAIALVGDPELLFLDEPTTGFDPAARREAWSMIDGLRRRGTTVLLTTHYLDEAQHLADRVAVVSAGRIVAEGDPGTLGGRDRARAVIRFRLPAGVQPPPMTPGSRIRTSPAADRVEIDTDRPTQDLAVLTAWAVDRGEELAGLEVVRPSLEDVYLGLVGERPS